MPTYRGPSGALSGLQYLPKKKTPARSRTPPGYNPFSAGPSPTPRFGGRGLSGTEFVRATSRGAVPKKKAKPKPGPVKPPSRPAGAGSQGTAATTPAHARTGAPAPRNLPANQTPSQQARAQAARTTTSRTSTSSILEPQAPTALTDEQLAQQIVESMYAPDVADLAAQEKNQRAALQQFTQALITQLSGVAPQVASDYDLAQTQQTALAQMASNQLAAAGTDVQAQTNADLAAIGAPQQQLDQLRAQNANTFGGGAATQFFTQGTIPGQSLAADRAAQLGYARNLPGIAGLQGVDALRNITYNAGLARQKLASEKRKSVFETTQSLGDRRLKEQAAAQNQAIVEAQLGLKVQGQKFDQAATTVRLQNDKIRLGMSQLQNDRNWQATLDRLGIADAGLKLRIAESQAKLNRTAKNGGWTDAQVARFRRDAAQVAKRSFEGIPIKEGGTVTGYQHWTYQEAMRELLAAKVPLSIAQQALNSYWSKPGARQEWEDPGEGRPFTRYQNRRTGRR